MKQLCKKNNLICELNGLLFLELADGYNQYYILVDNNERFGKVFVKEYDTESVNFYLIKSFYKFISSIFEIIEETKSQEYFYFLKSNKYKNLKEKFDKINSYFNYYSYFSNIKRCTTKFNQEFSKMIFNKYRIF